MMHMTRLHAGAFSGSAPWALCTSLGSAITEVGAKQRATGGVSLRIGPEQPILGRRLGGW
jgi:hypothetical protein